jgi:hypothetical protein
MIPDAKMAKRVVGNSDISIRLLEMFGIKDAGKLREATITFVPDDIVYINTTKALELEDITTVEMEFRKFKLVGLNENSIDVKKED